MGTPANELITQIVAMPVNAIGHVIACADESAIRVQLEGAECVVKRAASCLLAPEEGDSVLVCGPDASALYIIAVLERSATRPARLALGQDAEISTRGKLTVASDELLVRARHATTLVDQLASFGRELSASIGKIKLVGNFFESFFERTSQFAGNSVRTVEGIDQLRSASIDYRAEQSLNLQASEVIATAKTLVKVDGGQIHIG
ncbi:DUF3540 domain-containing protein [Uliginosibacterium sp. H3]|uniref:DUF3540 domain-containing protein n=1 Tax=Uliginosibacterium silvisoli TaxID=3114758 RepID=A0ABU6K5A3_9RHOO|nr:DUF3540 domain-containing protein [Uliginosibacterium sp. H3]